MIHKYVEIASTINTESVDIGAFVCIGKNVTLGRNVKIHPHVVIGDNVDIEDDVEIFPGAYIGKPPKGPALESHTTYKNSLTIGKGCVIGPNAVLYYGICIGQYTLVGDGVSVRENTVIGNYCIVGRNVTINYNVTIEDYVKVMDLSHITARTVIREKAFVAPGVFSADDNQFGKKSAGSIGGAEIQKNANIGIGALLLPCVKIGKNAIVGAGSIVTRDVPDETLVMGTPAKCR